MKKIFSFVVAAICAITFSANAQVINVEKFAECKKYLDANPNDTILGKDSKGINFAVYKAQDGKIHRDTVKTVTVVKTDTVFVGTPKEVLAAVNAKAINNLVNESLIDKDGNRDAYIAQSSELANYQQNTGQSTEFDGNIPVGKAANKFGWAVEAFAGVGYENSFKPMAGVGAVYTRRWWEADLRLGMSSREYTSNAENEGSYMTFMSSFMAGPGVSFGYYDTNKISLLGGVNFETYRTDSKIDSDGSYLRSAGSSIQGAVELKYRHRFFSSGNAMSFSLGYSFRGNVIQNTNKVSADFVYATIAFELGIARQKANYGKLANY